MEREIANVAAACAMRGFRYMAFPPIVFDAPPLVIQPQAVAAMAPPPLPLSAQVPELVAPAPLLQPMVAPPPREPPAIRPGPEPAPRRLVPPPPERRFALLAEVSAQLRHHDR